MLISVVIDEARALLTVFVDRTVNVHHNFPNHFYSLSPSRREASSVSSHSYLVQKDMLIWA